jgi:hypothetical protein
MTQAGECQSLASTMALSSKPNITKKKKKKGLEIVYTELGLFIGGGAHG